MEALYYVVASPELDTEVFSSIARKFGCGPIPVLGTLGEDKKGNPEYIILPEDNEEAGTLYWRAEWFVRYRIH